MPVLNLHWEPGQLMWYDPETGMAIMSLAEIQRIAEEERTAGLYAEQAQLEAERIEKNLGRSTP